MSKSHLIVRLACLGTLIALAAMNLEPAMGLTISGAVTAIAGADTIRRRGGKGDR